ncbi:MAG: hypothetical protein LBO08_00885 [Rickettsiales bacterium]|jgi:hypothetical protein|nr:hypothetical protein [Rickettsiales bacterium]
MENAFISIAGHLAVLCLFFVGAYFVIERVRIIAPDVIEISEIDLTQVQITSETVLWNTDLPDQVAVPEPEVREIKAETKEISDAAREILQPTLVDDAKTEKPKPKKTDKKSETKPIDAPKSKTLVRVNRNTTSLNRTMTISVIDALRVALTRCWVIDRNRSDIADVRAVAHLSMRPSGGVADLWFEEADNAAIDAGFAYVLETIRSAVAACSPFKMLPESEYENWKNIRLTFYPNNGAIK